MRKRIYQIIEKGEEGDKTSVIFDWSIILLIVISVISIIIESFEEIPSQMRYIIEIINIVSVIVFSVEYLLRLITADFKYPNSKKSIALLRCIFSFMMLIDLIAILPFYLPLLISIDFRFLRILRLFRILRILKLSRYSDALMMIRDVLINTKNELTMTISITFLLLLLSSSMMYYVENEVQPDRFPNIIASFWWGIATLTTVGYGDVYPITTLGKFLSGIIALLGIGIVALPTGIISAGFMEVIEKKHKKKGNQCPHCGKMIESDLSD